MSDNDTTFSHCWCNIPVEIQPSWFVLTLERLYLTVTKLQNGSLLEFVQWIGFKTPDCVWKTLHKRATPAIPCDSGSHGTELMGDSRWRTSTEHHGKTLKPDTLTPNPNPVEYYLIFLCYQSRGEDTLFFHMCFTWNSVRLTWRNLFVPPWWFTSASWARGWALDLLPYFDSFPLVVLLFPNKACQRELRAFMRRKPKTYFSAILESGRNVQTELTMWQLRD